MTNQELIEEIERVKTKLKDCKPMEHVDLIIALIELQNSLIYKLQTKKAA
jgi:hypothetical protein